MKQLGQGIRLGFRTRKLDKIEVRLNELENRETIKDVLSVHVKE